MHSPKIPIRKTGWFYLWLFFLLVSVFGEQSGHLEVIDAVNSKVWQKINPPIETRSKLVRVTDVNFDLDGLDKILNMANEHPQATFAFIGNYSNEFLKNFSLPVYRNLTEKTVLLSAQKKTSVAAISYAESKIGVLSNIHRLNPISELSNINWQVSAYNHLAFQPNPLSYATTLVWRNGGKYYPSFISQVAIISERNQSKQQSALLNFGINNYLSTLSTVYYFGYMGEIYANGQEPKPVSHTEVLDYKTERINGVILIDDLSLAAENQTAKSLASLIDKNYFYSNWLTMLIKYFSLAVLLFIIFRIQLLSLRKQILVVFSTLALLVVVQWLFASQLLWFSLSLIFVLGLISWLLQIGYSIETKFYIDKNIQHNNFLADAASIFYQSQNIKHFIEHLEKSQPNQMLVDSIYNIAIEAEANQNSTLAKTLHVWILKNNPKFSPSLERMSELSPKERDEPNFEQTLVIDPSGEKITQQTGSILQIESFGRYRVERVLGKGAMGIVFQGVDPKINRYVAIKTLQLSDELDDESLIETKQRFFREAETAGNLSHANIVTIYDVGEERQPNSNRSLGYIAMDLLTGTPLSKFIKKGKLLPPSLVYQLMIQMTDALDYAHRQKVIHRDIKPANIIYDDELQRGTLTDFGIAYMSDHSKTKTGTIMGSPYYMSPEQVVGLKVDGRSDVFSLGVTFYQLLSGELPFTGESIASVAFHITKTKHESVRQKNKKLRSSAARITNKAMQKDANKRYQTMQEFKQALIKSLKRDYNKLPLS